MKNRRLIPIILGLVLVVAMVGGFTLLWRFFVFAAAVLLISYLWPRLGIRRLEGESSGAPEVGRVGEEFEQEFTVSNRGRFPALLTEAREAADLPGYENAASFNLGPRGRYAWRSRATCRRRGRYTLGALDVEVSDPLGFFPARRRLGVPREIMVYPATLELPYFQALPRLEPGMDRRRWLASETGPGASRVREYSSGDSLRHIHWPTTAHTGELMVKEFDPDRSSYSFKNMWILLDLCRDSGAGEGDDTAGEYGVTIAASLAKKYIEGGKHVGLLISGETRLALPPQHGEPQLELILRALALAGTGGDCSVGEVLAAEADRFDEGTALVVVMTSDCARAGTPLRRAAERGALVSAVLLDSASFGGESGAVSAARSLNAGGVQAYIVRRGDPLGEALGGPATGRPARSRQPQGVT